MCSRSKIYVDDIKHYIDILKKKQDDTYINHNEEEKNCVHRCTILFKILNYMVKVYI